MGRMLKSLRAFRYFLLVITMITASLVFFPCTALASSSIHSDGIRTDQNGNPLKANAGGFIKVGNYYYWVGQDFGPYPDYAFTSVNIYRSTDLVNWEFRNQILTPNSTISLKAGLTTWTSELNAPTTCIVRPHIIYNSSTGNYVLVADITQKINGKKEIGIAFAECSTVDGNYTYKGHSPASALNCTQLGDATVFVDTDGTGYLAYLRELNSVKDDCIYKLDTDYLGLSPNGFMSSVRNGQATNNEAPTIFKRGNTYYYFTSSMLGWASSLTRYYTSNSLSGPWSDVKYVRTDPAHKTDFPKTSSGFDCQITWILPIQGTSSNTYLMIGDRWAGKLDELSIDDVGDHTWTGGKYIDHSVILPMTFDASGVPTLHWTDNFNLDLSTGRCWDNSGDYTNDTLIWSDNFSGGTGNWTANGGTWAVESGEYSQSDKTNWTYQSGITGKQWSDATYELDLKCVDNGGDDNNWAAIQLRKTNVNDAFNASGYFILCRKNGSVELLKNGTLVSAYSSGCNFSDFTHLKVEAIGGKISIYVNNSAYPNIDYTDSTYTKGYFSLQTGYSNWHFDNIKITTSYTPAFWQDFYYGSYWFTPNDGTWTVENKEYSQSNMNDWYYNSVIAAKTWGDATYEFDVKCVDNNADASNFAALQIRKDNQSDRMGDSGYFVYARSNGNVGICYKDNLIVEKASGQDFSTFRHIKVVTAADNIRVYVNNSSTPLFETFENDYRYEYTDGYVSLCTSRSHWHFDNVRITPNY